MFTARSDLDTALQQQFAKALFGMSYDQPAHRPVLEAEGLRQWVAPRLLGLAASAKILFALDAPFAISVPGARSYRALLTSQMLVPGDAREIVHGGIRWIETIPGKAGPLTSIFGPEQAAFDGIWKPDDLREMRRPEHTSISLLGV